MRRFLSPQLRFGARYLNPMFYWAQIRFTLIAIVYRGRGRTIPETDRRPRGPCVVDSIKLVSQLTETARLTSGGPGASLGRGAGAEEVRFRACLCWLTRVTRQTTTNESAPAPPARYGNPLESLPRRPPADFTRLPWLRRLNKINATLTQTTAVYPPPRLVAFVPIWWIAVWLHKDADDVSCCWLLCTYARN